MKLSVIIVNYNVKYFLEVCLHSVQRAIQGMPSEIIVVDNNSKDGSVEMVRDKFPAIILIANNENTGFSKANNQGVTIAKGEYVLFLNPDTVMPEDFANKMVAYMDAHPEAGSIGPRLIDGKGQFAPDGKKSFPSLSVAIFKTLGINKLFPKSPYFNKYYAVHIGERETAEVDVLSGCCMMVRNSAMQKAGGAFDEDYFMYCEDVDLSYRIKKAGYKNIYYPEVDLIHYKGESTRKATLSYVRIFNEALSTFVKKHYSKQNAALFILLINIGIVLRAILGGVRQVLKVLRMPLFDALILLGTLWVIEDFWVEQVKEIRPIPLGSILATFPAYILIWVLSLYINGAYDQPYKALRVIRGMVTGTVVILAFFGLLPAELRYSRAIIIFTAFSGTVMMLALHELLYRLGIFKFIPYDKLPRKAIIVASPEPYRETAAILQRVHYAPDLAGRISTHEYHEGALTSLNEMKQLMYTASINEVIFCVNGLTYTEIFTQMEQCGPDYDYKIHLPGSQSFVGSNSSHTAGDLYTIDKRYHLSAFSHQRNKRMVDIFASAGFLLLFVFIGWFVKKPGAFFGNIFTVLTGRKTWVGYAAGVSTKGLPQIKDGIIPPYNILPAFEPPYEVKQQLNTVYAQKYTPTADINLMLKNYKYLGSF
ncbi:glycosyltransferase family 2 protein [Polluticoccus soli]|uniref:glycosyltransferase family 2 protein n=1 Tax=Polluticoccus soli TaxID=3034150 RepID=UPI0023E11964|nr:glycosyltransferase [Flavipsychrobacter sp. JY13-12]